MYSYLKGNLAVKHPTQIVVDIGGIGYEVLIPLSTYSHLPAEGQSVHLLTHVHIREDAHQIFGFLTQDEKSLFRLLLSISGIGPKMALAVLSGLAVADLKRAIIHEDLAALTAISGIGRKTAERIIIELREKVLVDEKSSRRPEETGTDDELVQDTVLVLVSLGYKKPSAQDAIKKVLGEAGGKRLSVEELVRASLKVV
ncbi:MAG: Holliday junction branch migration protein RuvA [Candidatus Omnitrophica bacterium]|nr:Holliday junction branch migration protein RuvA [Candidatus Omnitrophota bacterium]